MYPSHLGAGDRIDFVEPPVDGPILGYSHQAVADRVNLYAYVVNNPTNLIDPSGLQAAKGKPVAKPCQFFVVAGAVRGDDLPDKAARSCKCYHRDLASTCDGVLRVGFGGEPDRIGKPGPKDMGRKDTPLTRANDGTLGAGSGKGKNCADATYAEISDCIRNRPKPKGKYNPVANNCQMDVRDTVEDCCLTGYFYTSPTESYGEGYAF